MRSWLRPVLRTRAVSCAPPRFGRKYASTGRVELRRVIGSCVDMHAGAAEPSIRISPSSRTWLGASGRCRRRWSIAILPVDDGLARPGLYDALVGERRNYGPDDQVSPECRVRPVAVEHDCGDHGKSRAAER